MTSDCGEYGIGQTSDCTAEFPNLLYIDRVIGNTVLRTEEKRQVLIPDIYFTCNGSLTRWIIGASWRGMMYTSTELRIWRQVSPQEYVKVNGTSVYVDSENASEVYEIETSLSFQEGDILGYFQPYNMKSLLDLYLEDSQMIITYHKTLRNVDLIPSQPGAQFSINDTDVDFLHPLIAVKTGTYVLIIPFPVIVHNYVFFRSSQLWMQLHVTRESLCTPRLWYWSEKGIC